MLIEGEKYACEACVRGHRVSTCQHSDRALTHINKKGRPVSQCPHCRGLRKARSSHVQCECGVKSHTKEECVDHSESGEVHSDPGPDPGAADPKCCCTHGMRCTCALKKDHLDPVPEVDLAAIPPKRSTSTSSKPRLLKAGSDNSVNSMTVFMNGHHKPVHKHNDSAHKCGLPYKIPIPHSVPGNTEYARRSTDSLPLVKKREETHSQLHESFTSAKQELRQVRSAHGSPEPRAPSFRENIGVLPPLDLQYPYENGYSEEYTQSPGGLENYYTSQEEPPAMSAGLSMPPMDWNDIDLTSSALSAAYSQPPSYASFEPNNMSRPPLATSSSGEVSEVEDYMSHGQGSLLRPDLPSTSSEDVSYNRLSSSSFTSLPQQTSALSSTNLDSLDYETYLKTTASPSEFEEPTAGGPEAFVRHGFTVHDAQKMAHPETPTEAMGGLSLPQHSDSADHVWAHHFEGEEGTFVPAKAESEWD